MSRLLLLPVALLLVLPACSDSPGSPEGPLPLAWTEIGTVPRDGIYEAITLGDRIYALDVRGGFSSLDPVPGTWTDLPPLPAAREDAVLAVAGDRILAIGGEFPGEERRIVDLVHAYDPRTATWRELPPLPVAVCMTAAVTVDGVVYVIGGDTSFGPASSVQRFDVSSEEWSLGTPMPTARCVLGLARLGNRILALGGITVGAAKDDWQWLATAEAYDPVNDTWTSAPDLPEPRAAHTAVTLSDRVLVIGGRTGSAYERDPATSVVWSLDGPEGTWLTESPLHRGRYEHGAALYGGTVLVLGGLRDRTTSEPRMEIGRFR